MTGVIATIPKLAFSANGAPLANGTVTTYLAGTTTLATTWQDKAQTSANTNPIVLDSRGEATIWLDGTKTYKFVLKDSTGATQWTTDNISGVTSFAQGNPVTVAYSSTVTVDASLGSVFYIGTLTGPTTLAINNPSDGQTINIRFLQDATGGRSVTLPGTVSAVGALITTANYVDWLVLTYVASAARWEGCWANTIVSPSALGVSLIGAANAAAARSTLGLSAVAFSLTKTGAQLISTSTYTKVTFDTTDFDTATAVSSSRFTAPTTGYYQINITINYASAISQKVVLYKNGSSFRQPQTTNPNSSQSSMNILVQLTAGDYLEAYTYQDSGGSVNVTGVSAVCVFQGILVAQ